MLNKSNMLAIGAGIIVAFLLGYVVGQKGFFNTKDSSLEGAIQDERSNWKEEIVQNVKSWEFNDYPATEWKTYTNEEYGFTLQYPSHYNYDENTIDGVAYNIDFGPSYESVFKKDHGSKEAASAFQIIVEDFPQAEVMENWKNGRGRELKSTENMGVTRKIAGVPATQVKICTPADDCWNAYFFTKGKYVYQVVDNIIAGKFMDRVNFEKMISTLQVK